MSAPYKIFYNFQFYNSGTGPQLYTVGQFAANNRIWTDAGYNFAFANHKEFFQSAATGDLYVSDGSLAGTSLLQDSVGTTFNPDALFATPQNLYFWKFYQFAPSELWTTDGTASGTNFVADVSNFDNPAWLGNQLFFIGGAPQTGNELWVSNGATAGTHLVKDIYQGTSSGLDPSFSQFEPLNNVMYFAATDGLQAHGRELWRSDGTAAGTSMVKDIAPGFDPNTGNANESDPRDLVAFGDQLFFIARSDNTTGNQLWHSDGTAAGTAVFRADIHDIVSPIVAGGHLFFFANDGVHGYELWSSDGTPSGTALLADINPGLSGSFVTNGTHVADVAGTLYFTADDGTHGLELWQSDGTPAGTIMVADINQTPGGGGTLGSNPSDIQEFGGAGLLYCERWVWSGPVRSHTKSRRHKYNKYFNRGSKQLRFPSHLEQCICRPNKGINRVCPRCRWMERQRSFPSRCGGCQQRRTS